MISDTSLKLIQQAICICQQQLWCDSRDMLSGLGIHLVDKSI